MDKLIRSHLYVLTSLKDKSLTFGVEEMEKISLLGDIFNRKCT